MPQPEEFTHRLLEQVQTGTDNSIANLDVQERQALLNAIALPGRHTERWRYTDMKPLYGSAMTGSVCNELNIISDERLHNEIMLTGHTVRIAPDLADIVTSVSAVADDIRADHPIAQINRAFMAAELLITVRDDRFAETPLILRHTLDNAPTENTSDTKEQAPQLPMNSHRVRLKIDQGKQATLIERVETAAEDALAHQDGWLNDTFSLQLGPGACLRHHVRALIPQKLRHTSLIQAQLGRDANYQLEQLSTGSCLKRSDVDIVLAEDGSEFGLQAMLAATHKHQNDLHLTIEHACKHGNSNSRINAIADQRGRVIFNGRIHIHEQARGSNGHLHNRNMQLSDSAQINTKPELEIYNDDVACSHGASIGSIDPTALFYLRSRGLSASAAQKLLLQAFICERTNPMLLEAQHEAVVDYLLQEQSPDTVRNTQEGATNG